MHVDTVRSVCSIQSIFGAKQLEANRFGVARRLQNSKPRILVWVAIRIDAEQDDQSDLQTAHDDYAEASAANLTFGSSRPPVGCLIHVEVLLHLGGVHHF